VALRKWLAVLAAAACIGIALGVSLGLARPGATTRKNQSKELALHGQAQWPARSRRAPGFTLRGSAGGSVSLRTGRGHIVLLTFLDSRCKRACPLEGRMLGQVGRKLKATGTPAELIVVTVDPWSDTRGSIRKFVRESHWTLPWHWLGGSPGRLRPVWHAYRIGVKQVPGDIVHSVVLYVVDPDGYLRIAYLFPFVPHEVARDIRHLARSY
jgi:cytochrome oxidase Cu insertion factor (SCO1/SenC/PrrC family)